MRFTIGILAALCLAGPVLAQATSPAPPPKPAQHQPGTAAPAAPAHVPGQTAKAAPAETAEKIDPAKEAAIRHLMDITQTVKLGDSIAAYLTGQVREGVSHTIPPESLSKFMDTFSERFSATTPGVAVSDAMVPIYANTFSMEDIEGLIQFYESPLGQRVVKALPDVVQKSQTAGVEIEQTSALKVLRSMSDDYPQLKEVLPPENASPAPGANAAPEPNPGPTPGAAPK